MLIYIGCPKIVWWILEVNCVQSVTDFLKNLPGVLWMMSGVFLQWSFILVRISDSRWRWQRFPFIPDPIFCILWPIRCILIPCFWMKKQRRQKVKPEYSNFVSNVSRLFITKTGNHSIKTPGITRSLRPRNVFNIYHVYILLNFKIQQSFLGHPVKK